MLNIAPVRPDRERGPPENGGSRAEVEAKWWRVGAGKGDAGVDGGDDQQRRPSAGEGAVRYPLPERPHRVPTEAWSRRKNRSGVIQDEAPRRSLGRHPTGDPAHGRRRSLSHLVRPSPFPLHLQLRHVGW